MRLALRLALLLSIAAQVMGKGAGAWLDAHHYKPGSFAGLRFIAEDPPHVLNVVGTDDGVGAPPRIARATVAGFEEQPERAEGREVDREQRGLRHVLDGADEAPHPLAEHAELGLLQEGFLPARPLLARRLHERPLLLRPQRHAKRHLRHVEGIRRLRARRARLEVGEGCTARVGCRLD